MRMTKEPAIGASGAARGRTATVGMLAATSLTLIGALAHAATAYAGPPTTPTTHGSCDALAKASVPNVTILSAEPVAAGPFSPGAPVPKSEVPAFCRVSASLAPSADSDIRIEVWLPDDWNGKYLANGVGGWGGAIPYPGLVDALKRGYATSGTDTGHRGGMGDADFALGHPEKVKDFAWRAVHEMTVQSKAFIAAYYGNATRRSYFSGCSGGGRQGLTEAQKFPADFDGIIAGAPAADWVGLNSGSVYNSVANLPKGEPPIIGPAQGALIHRAVIARCDGADGLNDGEVADPRTCRFKAASLVCHAGQTTECLTEKQAHLADQFYQPVRDPKTGQLILPGMLPTSELGWGMIPVPMPPAVSEFRHVVLNDAAWDPYRFDLSPDTEAARRTDLIDALNPDLSAFARHGKLIEFHGLSDPIIPTEMSINYYESVVAHAHGLDETVGFYRMFLVPGMGHCMGAYGVDWLGAMEQWVEQGRAPAAVTGHRLPPLAGPPPGGPPGGAPPPAKEPAPGAGAELTATRTICAYPQIARYDGKGSADAAESFSCRPAPRGVREGDGPYTMKPTP
jgi:feruloyl esterase